MTRIRITLKEITLAGIDHEGKEKGMILIMLNSGYYFREYFM